MTQEPEAQSGEPTEQELLKMCDRVENAPDTRVHKTHAVIIARALRSRLSDQGQATRERVLSMMRQFGPVWESDKPKLADDIVAAISPVEPRPQPDAAEIRNAALEEAAQLVDCGGCAGADRLKDGTCVRATSSDCYQVLANEIRSLITADKQEGG